MKNITRQYLDMIQIPDTIINRIKLLGKYQPEILVSTNLKVLLLGDGHVKLKAVDGDENKNEAPLKMDNQNNLAYQEYKEQFHTYQE